MKNKKIWRCRLGWRWEVDLAFVPKNMTGVNFISQLYVDFLFYGQGSN
jgi:hypothetical protein